MFRKSQICAAALLVMGGGAWAQEGAQRVEITGSAIKRINAEGPAPVEVVTRRDIERTGSTTVNELIRSIATMDIFDQGELASNSPAGSGTANVAMRGLSASNVLVLLNGRRLPVNALYDSSGAGAAFDINTLPLAAIERVEILKDGGSAIYGADAVAGVVNFITRRDFTGIEARLGYGQSSRSDGKEKQAGIVGGFGNLETDRFNVLLGLDVFKRDPILRKDRDISRSVDFRRLGSSDGRSSFSPRGNVVDPNSGSPVGLTYRECAPEDQNPAGVCRYDFNASLLTSLNGADRVSGIALGTMQFTPDIRGFVEVVGARTEDRFEAHPVPDYFVMPIIDAAQRPYEIPCGRAVGDDDYGYGCDKVYIAGRFMQGGPRITERKADMLSLAAGVEGLTGGLDWKANVGRGVSKVTNQDANYYDETLWVNATTGGLLDPTSDANDAAFVESLKLRPRREGKAVITYVNAQVGGDAFELPAGTVRWAVGASVLRDELDDTPDAATQAGEVIGSIQQAAVSASRTSRAVFGELQLPLLASLEGQAALRYDRYPGYSQTSPKFGLKWTPLPQFALRASYTESFRAPVLKQLYGAQEQGAITLREPAQCQLLGVALQPDGSCLINAFQVNGSNPDLQPEKGKTWNLGAVFEAGRHFNASVDLWRIKKTDDINAPTIDDALRQGLFARDGARILVLTNLQNISAVETQGVDVDARLRFPGTAVGDISIRNLLTYYDKQKRQDSPTAALQEYNGTYALPRWRNVFQVATEWNAWSAAAQIRSVAGFYDEDDPLAITGDTRRVGNHEELDLQASFGGVKGLTITGGIKNVLDRMPPFSAQNATDNQYTQQGFAELYNNRGRFWYLTVNYAFR